MKTHTIYRKPNSNDFGSPCVTTDGFTGLLEVTMAFTVYKPFKEALCKQLALKWQSEIDERLFNAMMNWSVRL